MKLCQMCNRVALDEQNYCAHDGQLLIIDPLATTLQESLGAKYTVSRLIGKGSMGAVYRAQHHALDDVAIKVMLGPPDNHKLSERFLREARALRKLRHPNAVLVYDLERSSTGLTYMVMEMIEGHSLRDELKQRGRLSLAEMIEITEAVCDALETAHEHGIIHRDLKPDNILLSHEKMADGDTSRLIKIVDFGLVKLRGTQQGGEEASMQLTKYGTPIGTPFYMSPEQWFGDGPGFTALDGRTDIYALGCTIYEMLSGQPPFSGKTKDEMRRKHLNEQPRSLSEVAPQVPEAVSRVVLRTLEKDRDFRPSSAAEFAAELRRAYDESTERAVEEEAQEHPVMSSRPQEEQPSAEQIAQLQSTEEAVPVIRNWAAEEAQEVIEQVRERQVVIPQSREPHALRQRGAEMLTGQTPTPPVAIEDPEATLVPGRFQVETMLPNHTASASPIIEAGRQSPSSPGEAREMILAQAGVWRIGLLRDEVESVNEWRAPAPLPHAPPSVLGIVSVRGRMMTLLDPAALLGEGDTEGTTSVPHAFIIALSGDEQLALAVNRVEDSIKVDLDDIGQPAESAGANVSRGVVPGAHGQIILLDTRELFAAAMQGAERRRQRIT